MLDEMDNETGKLGVEKGIGFRDNLPRGYLSVSQITQFMKCGRAYWFRYIEDVQIPRNSFIAQGSALHKAAEKLHIGMMEAAMPPPLAYVESAYDDAHLENFTSDVIIMPEDVDAGKVKDIGLKMIQTYYAGATGKLIDPDTKAPIPQLYPIAAERVIKTMLKPRDGDEIPFLGVIDIEEPRGVADLKTKRKLGSQSEADNSLQLSLYAYVTGKPDVSIHQLIKPTKTMGPRYIRKTAHHDADQQAHAVDIALSVATDVSAGRFPLTMPDSWWCSKDWCPYWGMCRGKKRAGTQEIML